MILVCFQDKPFNITVIQVYVPGSSVKEAEVEWFYENLQDLLACVPGSCFSCVSLSAILWTVVCQAPLFVGFLRQEYWNGLPDPPVGDLPGPGIKLTSLRSPTLAGRFLTTSAIWEAPQDLLELTHKKRCPYHHGEWNAKVRSQEIRGVTDNFGLGVQNEAGQRLTVFCQENALVIANTLFQQHKR